MGKRLQAVISSYYKIASFFRNPEFGFRHATQKGGHQILQSMTACYSTLTAPVCHKAWHLLDGVVRSTFLKRLVDKFTGRVCGLT